MFQQQLCLFLHMFVTIEVLTLWCSSWNSIAFLEISRSSVLTAVEPDNINVQLFLELKIETTPEGSKSELRVLALLELF